MSEILVEWIADKSYQNSEGEIVSMKKGDQEMMDSVLARPMIASKMIKVATDNAIDEEVDVPEEEPVLEELTDDMIWGTSDDESDHTD